MGRKVEQAAAPTSRAGRAEGNRRYAGFTLLEVVCAVAILALLAAIALPHVPRATSRTRLEAYALETAALLKADRHAAMRRRAEIVTEIDSIRHAIRSGTRQRVVRLPADVRLDAVLAARCNGRAAGPTIRFFADGMSCGGVISLRREGAGYEVRVNWFTGGVEVVPLPRA